MFKHSKKSYIHIQARRKTLPTWIELRYKESSFHMEKFIIWSLVIPVTAFGRIQSSAQEYNLDWFDYPSFCAPLRMSALDGATIASLSLKPTAVPLLFPKLISPFEWIDHGELDFLSLEDLCNDPSLRPPMEPFISSRKSPFAPHANLWNNALGRTKLNEKEQDRFDINKLFGNNAKNLPDDQQLLGFLKQGKVELTAEEKQKILESLFSEEEKRDFIEQLLKPQFASTANTDQATIGSEPTAANQVVELNKPRIDIPDAPNYPSTKTRVSSGSGKTVLKFKASKKASNGDQAPAQASDFYVTTQNLGELFKDLGAEQAVAGEVKSVAEMWAQAEKSSDPEIVYGIKSILLQAKVGKTRTDAFGQAAVQGIKPSDKYYLIGIEKDDVTNQITIWSKEVEVTPGENMIELSSNDVIYQE